MSNISLRKTMVFAVIVLFIGAGVVPSISSDEPISRGTIYVDDDADPSWYDATHVKTIQEGIDNATAGNTVFVYNGTYYERLIINKSILLTGEDEDTTIMHGYDTTGEEETVAIVLYPLENVSISGFTIRNSSSGILAYSMYRSHADNCSIYDNIFETGEGIGIDILLDGSTNMRIHDNIMNHGIDIYESFDNIIENNLIHGKSLVYLENKSDQIIENAGQVILNRCSNITVINCEITNTFSGIQLHKSDDTYVYNNILTGNYYGIEIRSEYNIIEENTIESNDYGILLQSQESNKIFHNNFITNIYQVGGFFSSYNMWYDIATESGNYWDDYDGIDSDGDGIGDTPYAVWSNEEDMYPFIEEYGWLKTIDVDQDVFDRGFPIRHALDGDWAGAQSFKTSNDTLTRVDVLIRRFGTPEFNLTLEVREDSPDGTLIESFKFQIDDVDVNWGWFNLDMIDINTTPGNDYFIVCPPAPSGVTTSFGYEWGYAFGNQYDDGAFWFTRDGGGLWRDLPTMYEFCFRTYGYS